MTKGLTGAEARRAGRSRWVGPRACAAHVGTYTVTSVLFLAAADLRLGLGLGLGRAAVGVAVNAVTHYWADRRYTLRWLCDRLSFIGKDKHYRLGAPRPGHDDNPTMWTGAYSLDQSFHILWLFVASLIIA